MNITGKLTGITYKVYLSENLQEIEIVTFDINNAPSACIIKDGSHAFAVSKWVSPKRTRSYPFERVYNTLAYPKKVTVIPIIKDEGAAGDRDFVQWDTISLMSLLDVFVILAYYDKAEKRGKKITNQQFDNKYILTKIREIKQYHSSALHWNLKELTDNLNHIIDRVKIAYANIEGETRVKLHGIDGVEKFQNRISEDVSRFMEFSREKARKAQAREYATIQPKERLSTFTKAKLTIENYLGGQYFFTVDEVQLADTVSLIEAKHSKNALLPSRSDIKDGLLKMILYSNLSDTKLEGVKVVCKPVLKLTSEKLKGSVSSKSSSKEIKAFLEMNRFNRAQEGLISTLFTEARSNNFEIKVQQAND
jgi:hypothetical protein